MTSPLATQLKRQARAFAAQLKRLARALENFLMPSQVNRWTIGTAWGVVIANIVLIITGGIVRLTGSGLGCATWPRCNGDDWTATPEMGIHGAIEFGNRMLTFALLLVTIFAFLAIVRAVTPGKTFAATAVFLFGREAKAFKGLRASDYRYSDLYNLNLLLLWGIIVQAVVGGITVLLRLNPWMVTAHYILTAIMIAIAAVYLNRVYRYFRGKHAPEGLTSASPLAPAALLANHSRLSAVLVFALLFLGTVVTGTGPHAGDPQTHRHAFDPIWVTRFHSVTVWAYCLTLLGLFLLIKRYGYPRALRGSALLVFVTLLIQAGIGYYQHFNGLPIWVVEAHLTGSGLFTWAAASLIEREATLSSARQRELALARIQD